MRKDKIIFMTQAHTREHAAVAGGQTLFPAAEWEALQASDREAARNIVCLMGSVFLAGLVGYLIIALIVAS
jgi:hypothetical protein